MGLAPAFGLLLDLRHQGFVLEPTDQRVRIAPKDRLTPEVRQLLASRRTELLAALAAEARLVRTPLDQFEREGSPIEIRVPWLPETLWFVPGERQVEALTKRGISRGRIWTARELMFLWSVPSLDRKTVEKLGRIKVDLGGAIVSVELLQKGKTPDA